MCTSSSWLPSQLDKVIGSRFQHQSQGMCFCLFFFYFCAIPCLSSRALRETIEPSCRREAVEMYSGLGRRNDEIFRKQPVLQGCHSAQPGSRLMTPSARKGEGPHKICIRGWRRVGQTARDGRGSPGLGISTQPRSPPPELPTAGSWALGALPSQPAEGILWVLW